MSPIHPIEWLNGRLRWLDQTQLPLREEYRESDDYRAVIEAIKRLEIRGAPLIGVAAGYAAALAANSITEIDLARFRTSLLAAITDIGNARPTAVNLRWALDRIVAAFAGESSTVAIRSRVVSEAVAIHRDDEERCRRIGELGAGLIAAPSNVLTHCNAGALATGGIGTAVGVITCAAGNGMVRNVWVDETRPLLQGARLTSWELQRAGVPATLITDNMAAFLMHQGRVDVIVTGADRIAANGDTANKIGTYGLAVLAKHHGIPFYIAAPTSTIDPAIPDGSGIPIEERSADEVTMGFGRRTAPEGIPVYSPAFDITPGALITAIITDAGIYRPPYMFLTPNE